MRHRLNLILICFCLILGTVSKAQTLKVLQGVVFKKGTSTRIGNAAVYNATSNYTVATNTLGVFTMVASLGDTLVLSGPGYLNQEFIITSFKDVFIYLQPSNTLNEVKIQGETVKQRLAEAENSYRKKGIYYKGKPPLRLLLPFGGSPVTFFYELLSKDGRRARRFGDFAQSEADYYEVASRFNDYAIKSTVPIKDDELENFKTDFWPKAEQVKAWNDFDLYNYIKKSYQKFQLAKSTRPVKTDSLTTPK